MAKSKLHTVPHKRKILGKTDYKMRLNLLKSKKTRLVVRLSLKNVIVQLVEYQPAGDKSILTVHSSHLRKLGWKYSTSNTPACYLTGYLAGKMALSKGVKETVLDIGLQTSSKGSKLYASLKGALDAGLKIPHSTDNMPSEDRINGKHISEYAKKAGDKFTGYKKAGADPSVIDKEIANIKKRIDEQK